jgi:hypothetical protein
VTTEVLLGLRPAPHGDEIDQLDEEARMAGAVLADRVDEPA